jgi:hypothetical protein
MTTCRNILFSVFFVIALLCCFGIKSYSNCQIEQVAIELPSDTPGVENSFIPDADSHEDDQVNHESEISSYVIPLAEMPIPGHCLLNHQFFFSVWQPPKIF